MFYCVIDYIKKHPFFENFHIWTENGNGDTISSTLKKILSPERRKLQKKWGEKDAIGAKWL